MPVEFLTPAQEAQYGHFTTTPTAAQLAQYFWLDEADREVIDRHRGRSYWQEVLWVYGGRDGVPTLRSLHHWYAFWHWHAPRLVPEMPLPQTAAAQRRWLQEMDATPTVWMRWTSPHPLE